jgi:predicted MPP superfamily phosphohydrolase
LARVRRSWASGLNEIRPGQHLFVSRGIGMERANAPRLRFLCRPELAIIDVLPQ